MKSRVDILSLVPKNCTCAEVGVLWGGYSKIIFETLSPSKMILIDCWEHQDGDYKLDGNNSDQNLQNAYYNKVVSVFKDNPEVSIIRKYSLDAVSLIEDNLLDFVYIDANHTYSAAFQDLVAYSRKIKPGGYIMGHDYVSCPEQNFGVIEAVGDFCRIFGWDIITVTEEKWPSYVLQKVPKIPKIIHTAWFGKLPYPGMFRECLQSWMDLMPDYEIRIWRETDAIKHQYFWGAYSKKKFSVCSDYFRCKILEEQGGIWLDIDMKVIKRLDGFLHHPAFTGIQRDDTVKDCVNPAIFGSVRGHWFVKKLCDYFESRTGAKDYGPTICIFSTNVLLQNGLVMSREIQNVKDVVVYPREYFFPRTWGNKSAGEDRFTENTVTDHFFAGTWL
jgi:hypothetical protein